MHRRAQPRHARDEDVIDHLLLEQRAGQQLDPLARGSLGQADQHGAVARRHHVAALDRGQPVLFLGVAPPDLHLAGEIGVELVDRGGEQRLVLARRPVERVDGTAAIDPAGGVAGVEGVGQRRDQVAGDAQRLTDQVHHRAGMGLGELLDRQPADQRLGQLAVGQPLEIAAHLGHQAQPDLVFGDPVIEDPGLRVGHRQRLGQQVVHLDHVDAAVAHLLLEIEMVALAGLDPHHVVEQQIVAVRRGQALMGAPGGADHHLAKLADLGMNTEFCLRGHGNLLGIWIQGVMRPVTRPTRPITAPMRTIAKMMRSRWLK